MDTRRNTPRLPVEIGQTQGLDFDNPVQCSVESPEETTQLSKIPNGKGTDYHKGALGEPTAALLIGA